MSKPEEDVAIRKLKRHEYDKLIHPYMVIMDMEGEDLKFDKDIVEKVKYLVAMYLEATHDRQKRPDVKPLLAASLYVVSILECDSGKCEIKDKKEVANMFGISVATIDKWSKDIVITLGI
jgi:hypothetical protein